MMLQRGQLRKYAHSAWVAIAAGAALGFAAPAQAITFTFEGDAATSSQGAHPGALTTLTNTISGFSITITRPGSAFDIVNTNFNNVSFPASFGSRSLDPFTAQSSPTSFIVTFSSPASFFSLDYGDFGGDADTLSLTAYSGTNGTGTLLASTSDTYGTLSLPTFHTASVSAANIRSVVFIGGSSDFQNSDYYDNFTVTPVPSTPPSSVPEPMSVTLLLSGFLGLAAFRRRNAA